MLLVQEITAASTTLLAAMAHHARPHGGICPTFLLPACQRRTWSGYVAVFVGSPTLQPASSMRGCSASAIACSRDSARPAAQLEA
jgi:hypothetical protein